MVRLCFEKKKIFKKIILVEELISLILYTFCSKLANITIEEEVVIIDEISTSLVPQTLPDIAWPFIITGTKHIYHNLFSFC